MPELNTIIKGRDNEVVFTFKFNGEFESAGLNEFSDIILNIGNESYSTTSNPSQLFINNKELRLKIGDSTGLEIGDYIPEIIGFSSAYNDGFILTSPNFNPIGKIKVI